MAVVSVARVERSETRGVARTGTAHPGFAALNPGYRPAVRRDHADARAPAE
jgi:hypothetical protein